MPGTVLSPLHVTRHLAQVFEMGTTLSCFTEEHLRFKLKAETDRLDGYIASKWWRSGLNTQSDFQSHAAHH